MFLFWLSLTYLNSSFIKLQKARIFPLGYFDTTQTNYINIEDQILFLGDSRIAMWPQDLLTGKKFKIVNIAHGGQTSSQTLLQLKESTLPTGKYAIIQTCINDIHSINAFIEHKRYIIDQCKKNITGIVSHLHKLKYTVVLTTLFPPSTPPFIRLKFWPSDFEEIINEINIHISGLASEKTLILDAYNLLKNKEKPYLNSSFNDHDFFLHINKKAYELLTAELNKMLFQI